MEKKGNDITTTTTGFSDIFLSEDGTSITIVNKNGDSKIVSYYFSNGLWLQDGLVLLNPVDNYLTFYSKMENNTLIIDNTNGDGLFFVKRF